MAVEIASSTLRDLTFILANVRDEDHAEFDAIYPEGTTAYEIALRGAASPEAWVAHYRGQPVAALGVQPIAATVLQAWAFGTRQMRRTIPALTRFIIGERVPAWIAAGITRVEARSIVSHETAHRWMLNMGGEPSRCAGYGRNGEDFVMFAWAARDMD